MKCTDGLKVTHASDALRVFHDSWLRSCCCSDVAQTEIAEFSPVICKALALNLSHQQQKIRISALNVSHPIVLRYSAPQSPHQAWIQCT